VGVAVLAELVSVILSWRDRNTLVGVVACWLGWFY